MIQLLTNPRAGGLGVSLATGITQPALGRISQRIGQQLLTAPAAGGPADTGVTALLANPLTVAVVPYRPLPPRSALGLSAFYASLLSLLCGFMTATTVNSSVDSSLGYATSETGPWWQQRLPLPMTRWQTRLAKWLMAVATVPVTTGLMLIAAIGILKMDAPYPWYLWFFTTFAAEVVAIGTLVLFAALGSLGQLITARLLQVREHCRPTATGSGRGPLDPLLQRRRRRRPGPGSRPDRRGARFLGCPLHRRYHLV